MSEETPAKTSLAIGSNIVVKDLAEKLDLKVTELITHLMKNGVMATINDTLDFETAALAASDFNTTLELKKAQPPPSFKAKSKADDDATARPPVVAVMGHVDHGKTTLLDAIRKSSVAAKEAGGITQHLSAYQIEYKKRLITFLDTPGHEAFALLRERGAHLTDLAIIVVAADDGVKPQTEEAIKFAQKAGVKMVVAITKIDKPGVDLNRIKQQLADKGLNPEEWGGDTVTIEVSAKTGQNLDKLLDVVLLVADIEELKARVNGPAEGTIIEAHMAVGHGPVTTLLVERGQLRVGDFLVAGSTYGKVRTLADSNGAVVKVAFPADPVLVTGWKSLPDLGNSFAAADSEKEARQQSAQTRRTLSVQAGSTAKKAVSQDNFSQAMAAQSINYLPLVVKADVHGSLEALIDGLGSIGDDEVQTKIVAQGVGNISESDVSLAASTGAAIIGFNVTVAQVVKQLALREKVELKLYQVIYELLDDIRNQLSELLAPETVEEVIGKLIIKGVFKVTKGSLICGGMVTTGKISPGLLVRRSGEVDSIGTVKNVQRQQQPVKEVKADEMCGLEISTHTKLEVAVEDKLEFFSLQEHSRSL